MAITTLENVKTVLGIEGEEQDEKIALLIELAEEDYLRIRNKPFDIDEEEEIIYPLGAESVAIDMISYKLSNPSMGVSNEKLGDHSVTYNTDKMFGGYPVSVTGRIKRSLSW